MFVGIPIREYISILIVVKSHSKSHFGYADHYIVMIHTGIIILVPSYMLMCTYVVLDHACT